MTTTVSAPTHRWVDVHRAALVIVILSMALAATLGLLAARLASHSAAATTTSVSDVNLTPTDNGCQLSRPGQPC